MMLSQLLERSYVIVNVFKGVTKNKKNALANILCCKIGSLPMTFLGMPLGVLLKATLIWDPIIEKMERKLSSCKHLYLSKGGRLTLLKGTSLSLLTYYLSLFTIPKSMAHRLERIEKNFFFFWISNKTFIQIC